MNHTENINYESILLAVKRWPAARRFALVQDVLRTLAAESEPQPPRERTLEQALRLMPPGQPAPTDEEVERWLDERRMEKYG